MWGVETIIIVQKSLLRLTAMRYKTVFPLIKFNDQPVVNILIRQYYRNLGSDLNRKKYILLRGCDLTIYLVK